MTVIQQILLIIAGVSFVGYLFINYTLKQEEKERKERERSEKIMELLGKEYEPPRVRTRIY